MQCQKASKAPDSWYLHRAQQMSTEKQQQTEKQETDIPWYKYFFLYPDKNKRIQSSPDEEVRMTSKTVSPFQIKDVIPSGGKNVSIFTHRLPFHVQEHLERITRRKL